jgi:hypothetical protein
MTLPHIGFWDILLVFVVSVQATVLAYVHNPKGKALLYSLPLPFTIATLAVGSPVGITHALGLPMVFLYTNGVRWIHVNGRVPIVPSIALAVLGFCLIAKFLVCVAPPGPIAFWAVLAAVFIFAVTLYFTMPFREEKGHRSPLPIPLKFVIVSCVIMGLIIIKYHLQGFVTAFPMVGIVAAYEARHCLWTLGRQVPIMMMAMVPLLATCRLTQDRLGLGGALAVSWVVFLMVLIPLARKMWLDEGDDMKTATNEAS